MCPGGTSGTSAASPGREKLPALIPLLLQHPTLPQGGSSASAIHGSGLIYLLPALAGVSEAWNGLLAALWI